MSDVRYELPGDTVPRYTRRLADKILAAFNHACAQRDLVVAEQLLGVLEMITRRRWIASARERRGAVDELVDAHTRLWNLRHPPGTE